MRFLEYVNKYPYSKKNDPGCEDKVKVRNFIIYRFVQFQSEYKREFVQNLAKSHLKIE